MQSTQSTYSWCGTSIHFILKDEVADAYNRVVDAFFAAQQQQLDATGNRWDPKTQPLVLTAETEDMVIYNKVAKIINLLSELNGGLDIPDEEIPEDHLIKL